MGTNPRYASLQTLSVSSDRAEIARHSVHVGSCAGFSDAEVMDSCHAL